MIILKFDGLFSEFGEDLDQTRNAGFMCYGWIILRDQQIIGRGHGGVARGEDATSNVAEYLAMIEGLDALNDLNICDEPIEVHGDAKCVIDQMCGLSAVNSPTIVPFYRRAKRLAERFEYIEWVWKPRRHNKDADWLTRHALRQIFSDIKGYQEVIKKFDYRVAKRSHNNKFLHLLDLRVYFPPDSTMEFPVQNFFNQTT
jgi:ribonuclease HI